MNRLAYWRLRRDDRRWLRGTRGRYGAALWEAYQADFARDLPTVWRYALSRALTPSTPRKPTDPTPGLDLAMTFAYRDPCLQVRGGVLSGEAWAPTPSRSSTRSRRHATHSHPGGTSIPGASRTPQKMRRTRWTTR